MVATLGIVFFFLLFSLALFVAHIAVCVWAFRDCTRRGRSPEFALLVLIGLFFFPVLGFIVYLLIRSDGGRRY